MGTVKKTQKNYKMYKGKNGFTSVSENTGNGWKCISRTPKQPKKKK